jgi:hypothetical protein
MKCKEPTLVIRCKCGHIRSYGNTVSSVTASRPHFEHADDGASFENSMRNLNDNPVAGRWFYGPAWPNGDQALRQETGCLVCDRCGHSKVRVK